MPLTPNVIFGLLMIYSPQKTIIPFSYSILFLRITYCSTYHLYFNNLCNIRNCQLPNVICHLMIYSHWKPVISLYKSLYYLSIYIYHFCNLWSDYCCLGQLSPLHFSAPSNSSYTVKTIPATCIWALWHCMCGIVYIFRDDPAHFKAEVPCFRAKKCGFPSVLVRK